MNLRKTTLKLGFKLRFLLFGHIFNPLWRSREERREVRNNVKTEGIIRYLREFYLPRVDSVPDTGVVQSGQEKIFSIWLQGEIQAPPLVRACFDSIRRHCRQELVVLDDTTLGEYIHLPGTIVDKFRKGIIKPAHYADICRVELLYEYGGIWLDSTCFATAPVPQWMLDEDMFVYLAGKVVDCHYSYMQNCFIRARKGSWLLAAWRRMILDYWMEENSHLDYFQHQLMFKTLVNHNPKAAALFARMPHVDQDPTHLLWYTIREDKWSEEAFRNATSGSFFQKTTYMDARHPVPGTVMYEMINNPEI